MLRMNYFILLVFALLVLGCTGSEKAHAQDKINPTQLSPKDFQKYVDLGWDLCNSVGADSLEGALEAIKRGADINFIRTSGELADFPLLLATRRENIQMVKLLLENGAKIDFVTKSGFTCLMETAINGNIAIAKVIIENSANINAKDKDGATPLICAAMFDQIEMIHFLIQNGADVNLKDKKRKTALMYAKEKRNAAIVKALKAAGAKE